MPGIALFAVTWVWLPGVPQLKLTPSGRGNAAAPNMFHTNHVNFSLIGLAATGGPAKQPQASTQQMQHQVLFSSHTTASVMHIPRIDDAVERHADPSANQHNVATSASSAATLTRTTIK